MDGTNGIDRIFFGWVCICFLLSFSYRRFAVDCRDVRLLRTSLALTVAADFCMLIVYRNEIGLVFFCLAQTVYHYRFTRVQGGKRSRVLLQVVICPLLFLSLTVLTAFSVVNRLAVCYAFCLLCALAAAVAAAIAAATAATAAAAKKYPRWIAVAGMILFTLCDINVGLYNLGGTGQNVFQILIWVFYLPSQLLLAFSATECRARL